MSSALKRLSSLVSQVAPSSPSTLPGTSLPKQGRQAQPFSHRYNIHQLSPTFFLPRAAAIEPDACAVYHTTSDGHVLHRTYQETADRARGFAYYLKKHDLKRVGILCPNTPAFLEAIFGIGAAGAINVAVNYRLKPEDIEYIFDHAEVDSILVDREYRHLLDGFCKTHPDVKILIDLDAGQADGPYEEAVSEGLLHDDEVGSHGWDGLETQVSDEEGVIALAYTSGTTAKPKGVELTHRGAYIASMSNVIESGLNSHHPKTQRCHYLWTV